jgi:hypothetical protein
LIVKLKDGEMKATHRPLLHLKKIRSYPILGGKSGVNASGIANFLFVWRGHFIMKLSQAIILKPNYLKTVSQGLCGSSTCDHKCSPERAVNPLFSVEMFHGLGFSWICTKREATW